MTAIANAVSVDFFNCDFFTLFGLTISFDINKDALRGRYQELLKSTHPDNFAGKSKAELATSLRMAGRINEAYRILQEPLLRATYLLSLRGVDALAETGAHMPADFLMQQLTWREMLETPQQTDELKNEVQAELSAIMTETQKSLAAGDDMATESAVRRWQYLHKLLAEINATK